MSLDMPVPFHSGRWVRRVWGCGRAVGVAGCHCQAGRWCLDASTAWNRFEYLWIVWGRVVTFRMFASPDLCVSRVVGCEMRCLRGRFVSSCARPLYAPVAVNG